MKRSYERAKEAARETAIAWQSDFGSRDYSYEELMFWRGNTDS